jgi:HlyD family secretion protein
MALLEHTPSRLALLGVVLGTFGAGCTQDPTSLQLVGTVERTLVEVSTATSEVIVAVPAQRGRHVGAGDVMVRLDSTLAQMEVEAAEARVDGLRARVAMRRRDLDRATDLRRRQVASQEDFDRAQSAWDESAAHLREAEARLTAARKRLADHTIAAPVSGVVDQIPFDLGERVPAGAVVAVLLEDGAPWVRVWIPSGAMARLAPGTAASIEVDGLARPLHGHILDVAREPAFTPHFALTERERVYLVYEARVAIDDAPTALRPGLPASVTLNGGSSTRNAGSSGGR